jgi:hypothetical protein
MKIKRLSKGMYQREMADNNIINIFIYCSEGDSPGSGHTPRPSISPTICSCAFSVSCWAISLKHIFTSDNLIIIFFSSIVKQYSLTTGVFVK